jgi:deoxycytidylate deaminase
VNFKKIIELSYALLPTHGDYRCRHASFIIYKDKIMSIGINNPNKTHPKNLKFGYRNKRNEPINEIIGIHSELAAVIKFGRQTLQDLDIVNTRIDRNNMLVLAKPCIGCQDMLKQLGINRIFFSNNQSKFEQLYF